LCNQKRLPQNVRQHKRPCREEHTIWQMRNAIPSISWNTSPWIGDERGLFDRTLTTHERYPTPTKAYRGGVLKGRTPLAAVAIECPERLIARAHNSFVRVSAKWCRGTVEQALNRNKNYNERLTIRSLETVVPSAQHPGRDLTKSWCIAAQKVIGIGPVKLTLAECRFYTRIRLNCVVRRAQGPTQGPRTDRKMPHGVPT